MLEQIAGRMDAVIVSFGSVAVILCIIAVLACALFGALAYV